MQKKMLQYCAWIWGISLFASTLLACGSEEAPEVASPRLAKKLPEPPPEEEEMVSLPLVGHRWGVMSIAYSPDGKQALSGSKDKTVKLWDLQKGEILASWVGHEGTVTSVAFGPYGRLALSGSADKTVRLWNVKTGKLIETFQGHEYGITAVAISPDGSLGLSGSVDHTAKLWDLGSLELVSTWRGHRFPVYAVAFSPDSEKALTGGLDIKYWDVSRGNLLATWKATDDEADSPFGAPEPSTKKEDLLMGIWSLAFDAEGKRAIAGGFDRAITLWEVKTGRPIARWTGHYLPVSSAVFSPDGKHVLSSSLDKTLRLWDIKLGMDITSWQGHAMGVVSAALRPDGKQALSGSTDTTLRLWKVEETEQPSSSEELTPKK